MVYLWHHGDMEVDTQTLIELLEAAISADRTRVRRLGSQLARALAEQNDIDGAKAIQALLRRRGVPLQGSGYAEALPRDAGSRLPLIEESEWPTTPVFLDEEAGRTVARFLEDARHIELLANKGVATRMGLLLHGAPGTGKSLLAAHVAAQLQRPIYAVRLDALISSRLGETAKNIRGVFEFTPEREAVLFLDEMDAIAKIRDDRHELGELKRVVNTVIQGLDSLSDNVVVVGATNHPHLLNSAIWRRFPYKVELKAPDEVVRTSMWRHFLYEDKPDHNEETSLLGRLSEGLCGADIENVSLAARRRAILDGSAPPLAHILMAVTSSRAGSPNLLNQKELSHADRCSLTVTLHEKGGLNVTDVAKIVGVSRQMAHRYLKEARHAA